MPTPYEIAWELSQVESFLELAQGQETFSEWDEIAVLESMANTMCVLSVRDNCARADVLEKLARDIVNRERKRRNEIIHARYEELASRRNMNDPLTEVEKSELSRLGRLLSEDH